MFDWDEEELANIIWDEAAENGDHIVPYPAGSEDCHNKKEWKQEANINKLTEQNNAKVDSLGEKVESSTNLVNHDKSSDSRMGVESWPLSNSERDSMVTKVSNGLSDITKFDSSTGADQLDKDAEIYPSSHEGKEQGDFDYGWANIGSFDDFERIFSNDDAVFGQASLGNADELWCSSKDVTNSPDKSFPISSELLSLSPKTVSNTTKQLEIKTEVLQEDDLCSLRYGETDDSTSHTLHPVNVIVEHAEDAAGKSEPIAKEKIDLDRVVKTTLAISNSAIENASAQNETAEKVTRQKKLLKSRKRLDVKSEGKQLQELYGAWPSPRNHSGQLKNCMQHPAVQPSPSTVQQMQLQCPEIFQYQHIPNQFVAHPMYGNLTNPFPAMPLLSHIQPGKYKQQPLLSSRDVSSAYSNPVNNSAETPVKTTIMTPQEKIEKLRRRQQLQAMLAIQKQQQQLSQQISSTNHSTTQTCPQQTKIQQFGGSDIRLEDLSTFPSLEPISPMEEDDSNSISAAIDDYSVEESILHRLQDVITKLDMTVRLCIRDSLFRLAQSAMERHYPSSTNKSSKNERETLAVDGTNTSNRLGLTETETNPMDRTVAHLLFHTPSEFSGQTEPSESTFSAKPPCETRREATAANVPETLRSNKQCFGQQETKVCSSLVEPEPHKDSSHMDTSENTSLSEQLTDGGIVPSIESSY
ncbi:protein LNK2 [Humulus lupulus]|uniref:protein LNK2 n=1 Tax=Humulus lupulus TaxID=3486 RepID=UPI002B40CC89|nr:protein LNK2 [Humulus lupulus]